MAEPPASPFPGLSPGSPIVDGETVRELVARHEAEIERLMAQLARVERAATEMEAEARSHPAYGLLDPAERRRLEALPAADDEDPSAGARSDDGDSGKGERRPRTTVDARPRRRADAAAALPTGRSKAASTEPRDQGDSTERGERSWFASMVTSHWVWKVGIALCAIAILLIKFG